MLKDDKFDINKDFDESGIVCLEGIELAFIIFYNFRYNKLYFVRLSRLSKEEEIANFIDCS